MSNPGTRRLWKEKEYRKRKGRCQFCGRQMQYADATIDHIVPRSRGGRHHLKNLQLLCKECNQEKGDRPMAEFRLAIESAGD